MRMKRILIERMRLLALVAVVFALTSANAQKVTVDGLKYYLYPDTHEAAVDNGNTWSGELVLPSAISYDGETYTVSGMGHMAFYGCKELTKVTIPKTIDHVVHHTMSGENGAVSDEYMNPFVGCTALESIEVDGENPNMKSVGGVLFSKDGTRLYCYPAGLKAEKYVVPEDVTWIGGDAFTYNEYVVSVELPAAVTYIGGGAFTYCKGLEKVSLPDNLTQLRGHTFRDCSSLKSIEIPAGVSTLGEQAFSGCTSLSVIDLPESAQTIGSFAFQNCTLDALVIRGQLDSQSTVPYLFHGLSESSKVYTLASQTDSFKKLFAGTVLTLDEYKNYQGTTNIDISISPYGKLSATYNLQGRRVTSQPWPSMYIREGKVVVVKNRPQ